MRFRNAATNGSGNAIITSDGILQIKTEDANAHIYMNSVRDIAMQTTSLNGTAGHFTFSSYNTEIMRIDGGNNRVGINTDSPNFQLHVNKGTSSYAPTASVNENVVGFNTSYDAAGSQSVTLSRLDGNWLDGTSGVDSAFGWLFNFQNNVRGGLIYDHRSTERMQLFSSYGRIDIVTPDAIDSNGVPNDSNMNERFSIEAGGKIISGPAIHIDPTMHTATYNVTGSAEAYNLMMPSFYGSGSINQTYRHAYNINTPFHTTLWQGGGGNSVFTTWSRIGAEHHKDIFIETYTLSYSDMKIKVITDANNNCSVWYAGATYNNSVYSAQWRVYPLRAATVTMNPSSSESAVYLVHAATGGTQETATADAATGSGPSTY